MTLNLSITPSPDVALAELRGSSARVDPTATCLRLRALAAIGHPTITISNATGWNPKLLGRIRSGVNSRANGPLSLSADLAHAVAVAYRDLAGTPGTDKRITKQAATEGWRGPDELAAADLATIEVSAPTFRPATDVDDVLVDRAIAGRAKLSDLSLAEREAAVDALWRHSIHYVAHQLSCTERTVERIRARLRAKHHSHGDQQQVAS